MQVARLRVATWHGREAEALEALEALRSSPSSHQVFERYVQVSRGQIAADAVARSSELIADGMTPRRLAFGHQLLVEALCASGDFTAAAAHLASAAELPLLDLDWLERCPVLTGLRGGPVYAAAVRTVRARAEAAWR